MFLLILDSLGSTELFFILVMALVFFGPRKLPQLSRSLGKNIAEFRKASEDFKRTWEREVAFEESQLDVSRAPSQQPEDNSILNSENQHRQFPEPMIEPVPAAESVDRQALANTTDPSALSAEADESRDDPIKSEPSRKQDWL
ncbi:MAG TPA: twin-arginine translocase TatA/TatE family subunit [Pyrinomonadaceae bacterium]|nr:twin-arginine translocase TatA/TatE family subunit [Pyrinomonadaceae bacterium]